MTQKLLATQPQLYWKTPMLLTTRLECTSLNGQILMWAWQLSFDRRIQIQMRANERKF